MKSPSGSRPTIDLGTAAVAAAVLGAFSTFADWVWARYIPDGAIVPGVLHGVIVFLLLALVLGWATGDRGAGRRLAWSLPLAGFALAALFYPIAYAIGYLPALLVTWVGMWLVIAWLLRWATGRGERARRALSRGLVAAVASGLAFWAISGVWTRPDPEGPNYLYRLGAWTFAFLPGFVALLVRRGGSTEGGREMPAPRLP